MVPCSQEISIVFMSRSSLSEARAILFIAGGISHKVPEVLHDGDSPRAGCATEGTVRECARASAGRFVAARQIPPHNANKPRRERAPNKKKMPARTRADLSQRDKCYRKRSARAGARAEL